MILILRYLYSWNELLYSPFIRLQTFLELPEHQHQQGGTIDLPVGAISIENAYVVRKQHTETDTGRTGKNKGIVDIHCM